MLIHPDQKCDAMRVTTIDVEQQFMLNHVPRTQVPQNIFQIWLGNPMPDELVKKTTLWQRYAHELGYQYQLITEGGGTGLTPSIIDLIETLNINMQPENITLIKQQYDKQDFHSVADILRYEIINHFGGIYVDVDFEPPTFNERNIDWFSFASKHDLTCFSEHHSREISGSGSYFCMNGLFSAPPRHPILEATVKSLHVNAQSWCAKNGTLDAAYVTGPFFFTRMIQTPVHLVPIQFIRKLGMYI